ncbi:hypothetical protein SAMN04490182_2034 [Pseudomonas cedrina]|uniref:Phage abortive infection protein n=2 Tax=Pseudomonas cedrina TaxID=651740 RepID=A0A1V2K252_PSECE|nr:hypothetical protein [Pseudomonas cedrina]ONH50941.1 hypothetical protein BLL36_23820 [Pseudomonas cedrina subsp. cedrina]SDS64483.1 hypothetical protein SAMN04490182_2034 [Pseudomonas cedrina]
MHQIQCAKLVKEKVLREAIAIVLVTFILGVSLFSMYRFSIEKGGRSSDENIPPISNALMVWLALVIAGLVLLSFVALYGRRLNLDNNIGQIGDFVGGLINPVLSFLALLVLLRTTLIQTGEARKTTDFMRQQQTILESEKFEATFFQLLDRAEKYCEIYLRTKPDENGKAKSKADKACEDILARREEFSGKSVKGQLKLAKAHVNAVLEHDVFMNFFFRAARVVNFVNNSNIPDDNKSSYLGVFRETLLPPERILFSNYIFFNYRHMRLLLRKWGVNHLREHGYVAKVVYDYYNSEKD